MRVVGRARSWGGARRSFSHHQISTSTIIIIILNYHCRQCHNHIHQHSICPVLWGSGSSESMNIQYFYSAAQFCICWIENQPNTLIGIKNKFPSETIMHFLVPSILPFDHAQVSPSVSVPWIWVMSHDLRLRTTQTQSKEARDTWPGHMLGLKLWSGGPFLLHICLMRDLLCQKAWIVQDKEIK